MAGDNANFEILEQFRGVFEEHQEETSIGSPTGLQRPSAKPNEKKNSESNSKLNIKENSSKSGLTRKAEFRPSKPKLVLRKDSTASKLSSSLLTMANDTASSVQPHMMSGANPDAESHLIQPLQIHNDSTDCIRKDRELLEYMPNALVPVSTFSCHFSAQFDASEYFPRDFFTTIRGLKRALDVVRDSNDGGNGPYRDAILYSEIGSRGGTIPEGRGEHASELVSFFDEAEHDEEFWGELEKEWREGPWADWKVDGKGNEIVPDPRRE